MLNTLEAMHCRNCGVYLGEGSFETEPLCHDCDPLNPLNLNEDQQ